MLQTFILVKTIHAFTPGCPPPVGAYRVDGAQLAKAGFASSNHTLIRL